MLLAVAVYHERQEQHFGQQGITQKTAQHGPGGKPWSGSKRIITVEDRQQPAETGDFPREAGKNLLLQHGEIVGKTESGITGEGNERGILLMGDEIVA